LLFDNIYQRFTLLETATCFTCFFVVTNNPVLYRSNVKWCHVIWTTVCFCTTNRGNVGAVIPFVFLFQVMLYLH